MDHQGVHLKRTLCSTVGEQTPSSPQSAARYLSGGRCTRPRVEADTVASAEEAQQEQRSSRKREHFRLAKEFKPLLQQSTPSGRSEADPSELPVLAWDEAKEIPEVADAEMVFYTRKQLESSALALSHMPSSFRWVFHFSENHMALPIVHGDVRAVYPDLTEADLRRDMHCLAKYFPESMMVELGQHMRRTLAGEKIKKNVYTWHSYPEYGLSVQVAFHKTVRYLDRNGNVTCVQIGETRDVTEAMAEHEALVSGVLKVQHDTLDHRFGNKLRMMHLAYQELLRSLGSGVMDNPSALELLNGFDQLTYEVLIRRGHFDKLPSIAPVDLKTFIDREFIHLQCAVYHCFGDDDDISSSPTTVAADLASTPHLLFFNLRQQPLSPIVLQVLILQDVASNASKHGTGTIRIEVTSKTMVFSNKTGGSPCSRDSASNDEQENYASSNNRGPAQRQQAATASGPNDVAVPWRREHVGLKALSTISKELDLDLAFEKRVDGTFVTTLTFGAIRRVSPSSEQDEATCCSSSTDAAPNPSSYAWVLLDDEPVICRLFKSLLKKRFAVDATIIQSPADVGNLVRILADVGRNHRKASPDSFRGILLIMDENVITMDVDCTVRATTGTKLRDILFSHPVTRAMLEDKSLLLFSSSASNVSDDRVLLRLGKTGSVVKDANSILAAAAEHELREYSRS